MIESKIEIQAHIYYEDLISQMINKINNRPIKYSYNDLTNKPTIPPAIVVDSTLSNTSENLLKIK